MRIGYDARWQDIVRHGSNIEAWTRWHESISNPKSAYDDTSHTYGFTMKKSFSEVIPAKGVLCQGMIGL